MFYADEGSSFQHPSHYSHQNRNDKIIHMLVAPTDARRHLEYRQMSVEQKRQ